MGLFDKKKTGGFSDVIRCDEPSYLIWKWHPSGVASGSGERENSIRYGSSLRVKDGEVAVFVYKQKSGVMQDYIEGPYDEKIKTKNFPVLASIVGLAFEGGTPFQAEIYFINLAQVIQVKFAVPFFDVYDPRFLDFGVPVAVRGTISFKIEDYKSFIKLHRLINFTLNDFQSQVKDAVSKYVKSAVSNAPTDFSIPVIQIERKVVEISDKVEKILRERLINDFGVKLSELDLSNIEIDKTSDGYRQLMAITQDVTTAKIQGQTAADIENYSENLRIQREETQYATHKQTQSDNIRAFEIEKGAEVGVAGAEALGKMGSGGAGDVDMSGGGVGFNPAAMMAGMALGGAIGNNVVSAMNTSMAAGGGAGTPPPIPTVAYYVAKDGKPTGPFDIPKLTEMIASGDLLPTSLVWKQGMTAWAQADTVSELAGLFPPPII